LISFEMVKARRTAVIANLSAFAQVKDSPASTATGKISDRASGELACYDSSLVRGN